MFVCVRLSVCACVVQKCFSVCLCVGVRMCVRVCLCENVYVCVFFRRCVFLCVFVQKYVFVSVIVCLCLRLFLGLVENEYV